MESVLSCPFSTWLGTLVACGARSAAGRRAHETRARGAALLAAGAALLLATPAAAQTNLVVNPHFDSPGCNPDFYTEYLCWPVDGGRGYFTVGTSPTSFNNLFNNCPADHTSGSGRMMILDGDTHRVAWAQTITDLRAGSTYRFRFWVMNLYNANPAVLQATFRPEPGVNWPSAVVSPSFPVQIAGCTWQKAEFYWTCDPADFSTAPPLSMTIVLENTGSGEQGRDFALDDLEFVEQCTDAPEFVAEPPRYVVRRVGASVSLSAQFLPHLPPPGPPPPPPPLPLPPEYQVQWSRRGVPVAGGGTTLALTGPDTYTSTLTLSNLSLSDSGPYTCTVTTPCGTVISRVSRLRVFDLH